MRVNLAWALAVASFLAPAATAWAQASESPGYVSIGGTSVNVQDARLRDPSDPLLSTFDVEASLESGWGGNVALGAQVSPHVRVEIEGGYRTNDLDELTVDGVAAGPVNGNITAISLMANGYVDLMPDESLTPYLGLGLGGAWLTADSSDLGANDEHDTVFAYQAMAGLALRTTPGMALYAGYRYFATTDPKFDGTEVQYRSHNLEIGLRFGF